MTVPGVAVAAGVAKTTVYRRYSSPAQLALAAIARLNPPPEVRAQLERYFDTAAEAMRNRD